MNNKTSTLKKKVVITIFLIVISILLLVFNFLQYFDLVDSLVFIYIAIPIIVVTIIVVLYFVLKALRDKKQ
jgi:SNF family Na+-dependent transporter